MKLLQYLFFFILILAFATPSVFAQQTTFCSGSNVVNCYGQCYNTQTACNPGYNFQCGGWDSGGNLIDSAMCVSACQGQAPTLTIKSGLDGQVVPNNGVMYSATTVTLSISENPCTGSMANPYTFRVYKMVIVNDQDTWQEFFNQQVASSTITVAFPSYRMGKYYATASYSNGSASTSPYYFIIEDIVFQNPIYNGNGSADFTWSLTREHWDWGNNSAITSGITVGKKVFSTGIYYGNSWVMRNGIAVFTYNYSYTVPAGTVTSGITYPWSARVKYGTNPTEYSLGAPLTQRASTNSYQTGLTNLYSITGGVFIDTNGDGVKQANEPLYANSSAFTIRYSGIALSPTPTPTLTPSPTLSPTPTLTPTPSPTPVPQILLAEWKFDENTGQTTADSTGHGYNGVRGTSAATESSDPAWVNPGRLGSGLSFDGGDFVTVTSNPALIPAALTLTAWVNPSSLPTNNQYAGIIDKWNIMSGYRLVLFNNSGTQQIRFQIAGGILAYNYTLPTNQWTHLAVKQADTLSILTINGQPVKSATTASLTTNTANLFMGRTNGGNFSGKLDSIRLYNYQRSDAMIVEDMYEGAGQGTPTPTPTPGPRPCTIGILSDGCFNLASNWSNWTCTIAGKCNQDNTTGVSGNYSLRIIDGNAQYIYGGLTKSSETQECVSAWVKKSSANNQLFIILERFNGSLWITQGSISANNTTSWQYITGSIPFAGAPGNNPNDIRLKLNGPSGSSGSTFYNNFDDIVLSRGACP